MNRKAIVVIAVSAVAAILGFIYINSYFNSYSEGIQTRREVALYENLRQLRLLLREHTTDKHRRPVSLDSLVTAGYLKHLPMDPMTKRRDSWILEWSNDSGSPGIGNVRSGSQAISGAGTRYAGW